MNRLLSFIAVGLIACTAVAPAANAQYQGNINGVEAQLQQRIQSGINSGRLTRGEAANLQGKLNRINEIENRMRMSGFRFSMMERNKLNNQLGELNREITRQLNDADTRWNSNHGYGNWNNRHRHGWYR